MLRPDDETRGRLAHMVLRPAARRRRSGGFTLLVALGVVAVVTLAVMLSFSVVGREADTQSDARRQMEAFFAAEAGLAEAREVMRLRLGANDNTYNAAITALGARVLDTGLGSSTHPYYEVLPGAAADGWNYYRLTPSTMASAELTSGPGTATPNQAYADYPTQDNVRYRVFLRDDADDNDFAVDINRQVWLVAVGEVLNAKGRPTRAVVQALITNGNAQTSNGPGCVNRGCGPDNTFNNTQDKNAPATTMRDLP
jgi:type II secretory pathway pseudopilin PulG